MTIAQVSPELDLMTRRDDRKKDDFDLEERTACFAESVIAFAGKAPRTPVAQHIVIQLVRAATSVGANYCEADDAESKKDFRHKISLCRKESREAKYWLRVLVKAEPRVKEEARALWQEAKELNLIFAAIIHSSGKR